MNYKGIENVEVRLLDYGIGIELTHQLRELGKNNNIIDVKFSTAFNPNFKKFWHSALVFYVRKKEYK